MHFESLHERITPLVFFLANEVNRGYNQLSVKITGSNIPAAIASLETTWKKFLPETLQSQLFAVFAGIAIFIACLGLFGLSAFAISQRVKEIGIRKVLGANVSTIVTLLSKDFLKLVGIAAIIAFPIAWFAMYKWLEDFAYRSSLQWWIFLSAAMMAAFVALITIGFQAVKAAIANPVKSLKTE
jgi:putative ABC transport system permease protein